MIIRRLIAASLAAAMPAAAQAQAVSCIPPAEAQALLTSFLPDIIRSVEETCRPSLPADAFLIHSGGALAERYGAEAQRAWKMGRATAVKIGGGEDLFGKLDDETVRKVFGAGISSEITKGLKASDCATVDRVLEALEPLPPANMSMLIRVVLEASSRDGKTGKGKFPLCPPEAARK